MKSHRLAEQLRSEAEEKLNVLEERNKEQSHQVHHDAQKHQAEIHRQDKQLRCQVNQLKGQPEEAFDFNIKRKV